jgi:hypothetical protein
MTLRKLLAAAPVIGVLTLAAPVASASAQTVAPPPSSIVPCYPYPAFCGPNGQPWFSPLPLYTFPSQPGGPAIQPIPGWPSGWPSSLIP